MKLNPFHLLISSSQFSSWSLAALLIFMAVARTVSAADAYGPADPNAVYNYTCPADCPPTIDATNFVINNSFTINFTSYSINSEPYEPEDTVNYTNNGAMTNNAVFIFDTLSSSTGLHSMAGNVYNSGYISCGSLLDTTIGFFFSYGQFIASATNIVNSGNIDVGPDDFIQLTGQNVDLSRSIITMEQYATIGNLNLNAGGNTGRNTNGWEPSVDLGANYAYSSPPDVLDLNNSTPYFIGAETSPTNFIIWAVFVQNNTPNVPYNVYFDFGNSPFPNGGIPTVQWMAPYQDPATGNILTNYLYLNSDPEALAVPVPVGGFQPGVPDCFYFLNSTTPLSLGPPATAGYENVFTTGLVTNAYAYVNAQLIGSTVATNASESNPSGALTNLPGRVQITAAGPNSSLNLSLADITGQNYTSLTATNQFDCLNAAQQIISPYSDINLGVTNGFMTITNLLVANIPDWNGSVQAWAGYWTNTVITTNIATTNVISTTYDFRVLLVNSQLAPFTEPTVQNLRLHGTNSLVINDVLNVIGTCYADAQNLTLATNLIGYGATSPDGELNLYNSSISWPGALPDVINLTNNGAIRALNLAVFGTTTTPYNAFINNSLLSDQGSTIYANNFFDSGTISNGAGSFTLVSKTGTFTHTSLTGNGSVSIASGSLTANDLMLQTLGSLTLQVTNLLTDTGVANGGVWDVGNPVGTGGNGVLLPVKPSSGDLLGTFIYNYAPAPNKQTSWTWAGRDFGVSTAGYTNNVAVGGLVLDALANDSNFYFSGAGTSNAIYVDYLELLDSLTNGIYNSYDFSKWLTINTNMVIYFAQAEADGVSIAEKINEASLQGKNNGGRLRWVPMYAGHFSSTDFTYNGVTYPVNAALADSSDLDSNGNDIPNADDPTPIFVSGQVNFTVTLSNQPPKAALLQWNSIPSSTNIVLSATNLLAPNWVILTNFVSPATVPPVGGWPITNTMTTAISNNPPTPQFFRVLVYPNSEDTYGF